jgi:RNA polymerase sigma-70 factor (ECF subfamily)
MDAVDEHPVVSLSSEPEDTASRKRRFEELLAGQLDALYRTALTLTRKREDAEDVVQDALAKAWRSLDSFREGENPRGWLIKIVVNAYRDWYRKQKHAAPATSLEEEDPYLYSGAVEAEALGGVNPEDSVLTDQLSDPVLKAIRNLPARFREPLLLVDLEEFSYGEAAEILGVLAGTVMSRLHRARKLLGRELADYVTRESSGRTARLRKRAGPVQAQARRRMISCGEACRHLHAYIDGVLTEGDTRKVDEHLAACRQCCDRFEFERRQKALLVMHHLGTKVPRPLLQRMQQLVTQF